MVGKGNKSFKIVMNEKWHMQDTLGVKYKIISKPLKDSKGNYMYDIEEYKPINK